MTARRTWLGLALLTLAACASTDEAATTVRIFDEELRQAFEDFDRTMSAPRSPLELHSGATISTCGEYLQQAAGIKRGEHGQMLALQDYVLCDSVALLQHAQPARESGIDAGAALATRLDFRTFGSSRGPRTSEEAFSFQTLVDEPLLLEPNAATLDSADWYLRVERVAAADFDGNGKEDWLVWISDDSHVGTYQSFHAVLIYNVAATGRLIGDPVPPRDRADTPAHSGK
jgi:hypothetical protein